jgi:hypothetical protein
VQDGNRKVVGLHRSQHTKSRLLAAVFIGGVPIDSYLISYEITVMIKA